MASENFEHHACYLTARIAATTSSGVGTIGTGFVYRIDYPGTGRLTLLLISNRHVLADPAGTVAITFNRKLSDGTPDFGNAASFHYQAFGNSYFAHSDANVDLACINISNIADTDVFYKTLHDSFLQPIDLSLTPPSTVVQFVGYPDGRYDVRNNLPLIRTGSIASLPDVDFNGKPEIVIDAQVFPGSSGSPVFVPVNGEMRLLGVVSETMIRHNELQTVTTSVSVGVREILGLGLVIKQAKVKELIDRVSNIIAPTLTSMP